MSFLARTLHISAGVIVWALHFAAIYGFTGLACARGFGDAAPLAIAIATLLAVVAVVPVIVAGWRRRAHFEGWLSATIGGFALLAILYQAVPAWLVPTCP